MRGGADWDFYTVDSYRDIVIESAGDGLDRIYTALRTYVLPRNVEALGYDGPDGGTECQRQRHPDGL